MFLNSRARHCFPFLTICTQNGEMNLAELKEACTAVGIDLPEAEVERRMREGSSTSSFLIFAGPT